MEREGASPGSGGGQGGGPEQGEKTRTQQGTPSPTFMVLWTELGEQLGCLIWREEDLGEGGTEGGPWSS